MNGYKINVLNFNTYKLPEREIEVAPNYQNKYKSLHKYQLRFVKLILDKKKYALYAWMGAGKTIITLTAIVELLKTHQIKKILVIAPLRVINKVWPPEIETWEHTRHLTYSLVTGNESERLAALKKEADIYLINNENVIWSAEHDYTSWDMIVIDESTSFKSHSAKRFKTVKRWKYDYMVQLTGIPSPNSLTDLWSQIFLLDGGKRLGKSFYQFTNMYFYPDYSGYKLICRDKNTIYDKISDITVTLKPADYIELPSKIKLNTYVDIGEYPLYNELKKEFLITVDKTDIIALNAAALTSKLLQFCNGAIYDKDKKIIEIHDAKLKALEEIIEGNPNDNLLVAYNFRSDLIRLKKRFPTAVILDKEGSQIDKWNNGEIKLMLCHPASCGKGLNLQKGGNTIVWFSLTWSLEDYMQFNARLHRQGQQKPVVINHILAKGCIDEIVLKMLNKKKMCLDELLDALK